MKPTVSNPSITFDELLEGYKAVTDSEHIAYINDQIIAKLQRAKFRMDQKQLNFLPLHRITTVWNILLPM